MKIKTQLTLIAVAMLVLSLLNAVMTIWHTQSMEGHGLVVNVTGQVRGGAQRVAKLTMAGKSANTAIAEIDDLLSAVIAGSDALDLPAAQDGRLIEITRTVQASWRDLKQKLSGFRDGTVGTSAILEESEAFFTLSNRLVETAVRVESGSSVLRAMETILLVLDILTIIGIIYLARRISLTLSETSEALAASANEIATTIEEQERVSINQAASINETVTTMEELEASLRQTTDQSEGTADLARKALSHTEVGSRAVATTIEGMAGLKKSVENVAEGILRLSEQIGQIGEITNTVADLASRTNMLALNASVEAARAGGEHGKGFAVVAGEIRKLADESRKSTERIDTLVSDIQKATNTTVMVTEEGTKTVDKTSAIASDASGAFQELDESMNSTYASTQQTLLSIRQQLAAIEQVSEAMVSLNAGAEESTAGMSQTKEGVRRLRDMAERLEALV